MKKSIVFVMAAAFAVSLGSFSFAQAQKAPAKPAAKTAPAPKKIVLLKGIQIDWCGKDVKANGTVDIINGITAPVKNGKFDLIVPEVYAEVKKKPVEGEEPAEEVRRNSDADFGDVKVLFLDRVMFNNSKSGEGNARGTVYLSLQVLFAEKAVKGTLRGEPVSLKKGWNILGDKKKKMLATCPCVG